MGQADSLDPAFGTGGIVTMPNSNVSCNPCGLAIQSDGKIVVAGGGTTRKGFPEVAVARFNTNGTLDSTFGSGGIVTTTEQDLGGGAFAMALQRDRKIVVATTRSLDLQVIRYNSNGSLDTIERGDCGWRETAVDSPAFVSGQPISFALARYTASGQLDTSFGTDGLVTTAAGHSI
jgi:uncharacterized delta-60 repeat protein